MNRRRSMKNRTSSATGVRSQAETGVPVSIAKRRLSRSTRARRPALTSASLFTSARRPSLTSMPVEPVSLPLSAGSSMSTWFSHFPDAASYYTHLMTCNALGERYNPLHPTGGRCWIHGRASSKAAEAEKTVASAPRSPMMCRPMGRPSEENPHGMLAAVEPIMLIGIV